MAANTKATPRAYHLGFNDTSGRTALVAPEQIPQHLAHIFLLTKKGPTVPMVAIGDSFSRTFGIESLDPKSPFATHQTALAVACFEQANAAMVHRIKLAGATTSMIRLSAEVIPAEIPLWERNPDGSLQLDASGNPIQQESGGDPVFTIGYRVVWYAKPSIYPTLQQGYGQAQIMNNYRDGTALGGGSPLSTLVDAAADPVTSTVYPIMDIPVSSFGSWGDSLALSLLAPNTDDLEAGDADKMEAMKSYLYDFAFAEKPVNLSTPNVIETPAGGRSITASLLAGALDPVTNAQMYAADIVTQAYRVLNDPTVVPEYGPFEKMHVYTAHLETLMARLIDGAEEINTTTDTVGEGSFDVTAGRTSANKFAGTPANKYLLNIFTATDHYGSPYYAFSVSDSVKFGGVSFGPNAWVYASGGSDGFVYDANGKPDRRAILQKFDDAVQNELLNWGDLDNKLLDMLRFPSKVIYDSGFSLNTKHALLVPMSRRPDMYVVQATQAVAEYANTSAPVPEEFQFVGQYSESVERSMAIALQARAMLYPESAVYGTKTCRVGLVRQSGTLINSQFTGILPLTIEIASKFANYMGASDGKWKAGAAPDARGNKTVTLFRDINVTWKKDSAYNADWDLGLIWAQNYDMSQQFFPAYQTVYPDSTSVLNSLITVAACCELVQVAQRVWRELVGDATLTPEEFLEQSDKLIVENTQGRFNNRFRIEPKTEFTAADKVNGFSWHTVIAIGANTMPTAGFFTINPQRLSEFVSP